jgi:uncharacterized protein
MKAVLKQVIYDQQKLDGKKTIDRHIPRHLIDCPEVLIISGVRRCGKSVLLQQIREHLTEKDYFLNFDDDRLAKFTVDHFQQLYEVFIELFGEQKTFYFDEIQNIKGWELFIRRLYDSGCKVFITGSNANMLSRELGTHLTGRFCSYELYPFSFAEYLELLGNKIVRGDFFATTGIPKLTRNFNDYLNDGGFPQFVITKNRDYLKSLYESIVYKDVLVHNKLTNEKEMIELVYYLASNVSRLSSYSSLSRTIGLKHSATVKNYIGFLENTYLLFQIPKFDFSLKKQMANAKKTYFIDNAIIQKIGFNFSGNLGRLLENLVFIELKRRGYEVFYYAESWECDFIVRKDNKIIQAIQVCYLLDEENEAREKKGLLDAMNYFELKSGWMITTNKEDEILKDGRSIHVELVWKWLLNAS